METEAFKSTWFVPKTIVTRKPKRVILLDDDPSYVALVKYMGDKLNLKVHGCDRVDVFVGEVLDGNYDVALIDYNLSGTLFTGTQIARLIPSKPSFIVSADKTAKFHCQDSSIIRGFFAKDGSPKEMLRKVRRFIDSQAQ